jgi:pyridoxine 5-phosphate synthase
MLMSLNLNKIALVRNARGKDLPSLADAAALAVGMGWGGLTIHPRADERHARLSDIAILAAAAAAADRPIEINIECDPRDDVIAAALAAKADQITLVPVDVGEVTTTRGWSRERDDIGALARTVARIGDASRVSIFIDPEPEGVALARAVGAGAVELHTEHYVTAFERGAAETWLPRYEEIAAAARAAGLRVNLGHGLDTANLPPIAARTRPDEVSIGHAAISDAIMAGLRAVSPLYLGCAAAASPGGQRR